MKTELIIRSNSSDIDFALLKDGKLVELHNETLDNNFSVGDIFLSQIDGFHIKFRVYGNILASFGCGSEVLCFSW